MSVKNFQDEEEISVIKKIYPKFSITTMFPTLFLYRKNFNLAKGNGHGLETTA